MTVLCTKLDVIGNTLKQGDLVFVASKSQSMVGVYEKCDTKWIYVAPILSYTVTEYSDTYKETKHKPTSTEISISNSVPVIKLSEDYKNHFIIEKLTN